MNTNRKNMEEVIKGINNLPYPFINDWSEICLEAVVLTACRPNNDSDEFIHCKFVINQNEDIRNKYDIFFPLSQENIDSVVEALTDNGFHCNYPIYGCKEFDDESNFFHNVFDKDDSRIIYRCLTLGRFEKKQ